MEDFIVKTDGHCFLCSDQISNQHSIKNLGSGSGEVAPVQTHSLQYLSRYLKICMRKVFNQEGPVSSDLLEKVERAKLKVELCQECSALNDTFSKLYKKLEKAELEVISCVSLFHRKFLKAKVDFSSSKSREDLSGRAEIVQILRAEGLEKCAGKLRNIPPRLKIQKLTTKQMSGERQQLKVVSRQNAANNKQRSLAQFPERDSDDSGDVNFEVPIRSVKMGGHHFNHLLSEDIDFDYSDDMQNNEDLVEESKSNSGAGHRGAEGITHKALPSMFGIEKVDGGVAAPMSSSAWPQQQEEKKACYRFNPQSGKYECTLCSREFKTAPGSILHYQSFHLKTKLKCNICGKEFTRRPNFKRHYESAHMGVKFKCLGCGKVFNFKTNLDFHQRKTGCGVVSDCQNKFEMN